MFLNPNNTVSGFTLPTTTPTNTGFSFGAGDAKTTKPTLTLGTPIATATTTPSTGFNLGTSAPSNTTQFSFTGLATTPASCATPAALSFSLPTTTTPSLFSLNTSNTTTTPATTTSTGFSLTNTTLAVKLPISSTTTTTSNALTGLASGLAAVSSAVSLSTTSAAPAISTLPSGSLTFTQLEDNINKWTVELEEQGKHFTNQAKQINAWDRLLITNGEKILSLSNGISRVKLLQQQLDQELDFVLAQQKELEDLVVPLEKELSQIPVTDFDRNQTYQMAETLDTQLKQMSEDLKEIIEHLNEASKNQELSNPVTQIGRILNAHMNSLQWIDRNTSKISTHLDQISKMHDMNKRNHEMNLQRTYD
nr:nuclear pore glycoprotein p62 [Onthophagus taurus]